MAFAGWDVSQQKGEFILLIVLMPLGIAITALRFIAMSRIERKPGLEDWMAVIATAFFVLSTIASLMTFGFVNDPLIHANHEVHKWQLLRELDMAAIYFYIAHCYCLKISILAFYRRMFSIRRTFKTCIWAVAACVSLMTVILLVFPGMQCTPFDLDYFYSSYSASNICTAEASLVLGIEVPNSFFDFILVFLAMFMIRPLQLSSSTKWRLRLLFSLGACVGIIGLLKAIITYYSAPGVSYSFGSIATWTSSQMFASLLCCCFPVCYPLLPRRQYWCKLASWFHPYVPFGWCRRSRPTIRSVGDTTGSFRPARARDWNLMDDQSTKAIAWPATTHQVEAYALGDWSDARPPPGWFGIQVERSINVV
ncbi:hypothetical protein F4780DRAFT_1668 [Xylariomycetidae sp. FL0641]|nr:hypothetical protein F4780DRAFT_1668 [Xylariomycetidae sp. FL0641]